MDPLTAQSSIICKGSIHVESPMAYNIAVSGLQLSVEREPTDQRASGGMQRTFTNISLDTQVHPAVGTQSHEYHSPTDRPVMDDMPETITIVSPTLQATPLPSAPLHRNHEPHELAVMDTAQRALIVSPTMTQAIPASGTTLHNSYDILDLDYGHLFDSIFSLLFTLCSNDRLWQVS